MVGTGDRSERIRTYNFPQSRVTDHRVNLTLHQLDQVLDGEIDPLIDALATHEQAEALSAYAERVAWRDDAKRRARALAAIDRGVAQARGRRHRDRAARRGSR